MGPDEEWGSGNGWYGFLDRYHVFALFSSINTDCLLISMSSAQSAGYGVSVKDCCKFYTNIRALAKKTTVWPHPEELLMLGFKLQGYETIQVASLSMGLSVPMYATADKLVWSTQFQRRLQKGIILINFYNKVNTSVSTLVRVNNVSSLKH